MPAKDESHLIQQVLKGNPPAFRLLVEAYQSFVFTLMLRMLQNREEAEEASQDVFMKAFRMLPTFGFRSKFTTWLYTIAYRTATDRLRARKQIHLNQLDTAFQLSDQSALPDRELQQADLQNLIHQAIAQLPTEDATLLMLYYWMDQSVKEIAQVTGLTESNVKVKLYRLREQLRLTFSTELYAEVKNWI